GCPARTATSRAALVGRIPGAVRGERVSVSVTSDFRHAYQSASRERMRKRFLVYTIVMSVVQFLGFALSWELFVFDAISLAQIGLGFSVLLSAFIYIGAHVYVKNASRRLGRGGIVGLTVGLMLSAAFLRLPYVLFGDLGDGADQLTVWCLAFALAHVIASCFVAWSARESLIPLLPFFAALAIIRGIDDGWSGVVSSAFLVLLLGAPGVLIAWGLTSQYRTKFQNRFLRSSYTSMKRELVDARRIHEDLFPDELESEHAIVRYAYEPMRQIGGDYLFIRETAGVTNVVLIDVTGHGVTAALTINRLQGEIQRHYGTNPAAAPGETLAALNDYINLTLATHSVYATAVCVQVDHERDAVRYASAGHPPAFLIATDKSIDQLESTTFLLGVCKGDDFVPGEREAAFHAGDTLIAYTDGATEAMDIEGRMLGVMGFLRTVASITPGERGWCQQLKHEVETHRDGPPADDTLIVEVTRPLVL
ncbi:MAG: SpoIIE family protein phosphatase, partial [Planctomycetota bacterium]